MADADYDDFDAGYGETVPAFLSPSRLSRMIHIGGAVASVGLVVWLALWGYDAAVRGAHGVPVIAASKEPMRIQPENPGGEVVDHQGLAVNEIAAIGVAAPPADRLMLAPPPVELTDQDVAGLTDPSAPVPDATTAMAAAAILPADGLAPMPDPVDPLAAQVAALSDTALANPAAPVMPAAEVQTDDAVAAALAEALSNDTLTEDVVAMDATLSPDAVIVPASAATRPRARPESAPLPSELGVDGQAALPVTEIDPATLTAGTRLAQLGAFDSPEQARSEWVRMGNAYADLMLGKAMVIQSATSGGRSFYRLRAAGFEGEDASRDFCTEIVERNGTCIPVVHR
ncbi:MAG: sporulation protein [Rhodobacteraceae bacterium PARR1]|nr:MAG: sporulation protein [Rhodobacteraceae bacterium PARR1]